MQETGLTLETASEYLCLATRLSRDHASIQPLLDAGRRRLRASFGNLDNVWEEADGRRQFAGLPLEAVQVRAHLHDEVGVVLLAFLQSHQAVAGLFTTLDRVCAMEDEGHPSIGARAAC